MAINVGFLDGHAALVELPDLWKLKWHKGWDLNAPQTVKIELKKGPAPTMAGWRKRLFIATSYITADAAEFFGLPRDRTVIMGSRIEV